MIHSGPVDANGKPTHTEGSAKYDGKEYPMKGSPSVDSVSMTRVDSNTSDFVEKKDGKTVATGHIVVSKDGKTTTETIKAKNAQGQEATVTLVFDKQQPLKSRKERVC